MEEKRIKHYSSHHKILLVGEGDFSFSLCLAKAFGSASNMVATSLDSQGSLTLKYSRALTNLKELENLGCTIVHEVDVETMNEHPLLQTKCFDRIVFNFPHAGFAFREHNPIQIWLHQKVVSGFLKSTRKMVREDGEIHVTHKNAHPFCNWNIVKLAEEAGLFLADKVPFYLWEYQGYVNKRGAGHRCDGSFPVGDSSTFKFSKGLPRSLILEGKGGEEKSLGEFEEKSCKEFKVVNHLNSQIQREEITYFKPSPLLPFPPKLNAETTPKEKRERIKEYCFLNLVLLFLVMNLVSSFMEP